MEGLLSVDNIIATAPTTSVFQSVGETMLRDTRAAQQRLRGRAPPRKRPSAGGVYSSVADSQNQRAEEPHHSVEAEANQGLLVPQDGLKITPARDIWELISG